MHWPISAIALLFIGLFTADVRADSAVLLLESPGLRPDLCTALRIQLTALAEVTCLPEGVGENLSRRIDAAATAVRSHSAQLGVLLDRDADPTQVRMLLVGARGDEAVIAIERIEDRPAPDVDRSLALKVRDALDVIVATAELVARTPGAQKSTPLVAVLAPSAESTAVKPHLRVLFEAGAAASLGNYQRAAGQFALGLQLRSDRYYAESLLGTQVLSTLHIRKPEGTVDVDEWTGALALRFGRAYRRISIGGYGELGFSRVGALGTTADGSAGSARTWMFRSALGVDLRVALGAGVSLRIAPAIELFPVAQRFSLDQQVSVDLGHARVVLPLSLMLSLSRPRAGAQ